MIYVSKSLEETEGIASSLLEKISPKKAGAFVVGLSGDLGAGKTAFTKAIAKNLGVDETVTSPTFVIEKIYDLPDQNGLGIKKFKHLIHIDAYRLEKPEELLNLGWQNILKDKENLILIEWPENVSDIMPEHLKISLKSLPKAGEYQINIENLEVYN